MIEIIGTIVLALYALGTVLWLAWSTTWKPGIRKGYGLVHDVIPGGMEAHAPAPETPAEPGAGLRNQHPGPDVADFGSHKVQIVGQWPCAVCGHVLCAEESMAITQGQIIHLRCAGRRPDPGPSNN